MNSWSLAKASNQRVSSNDCRACTETAPLTPEEASSAARLAEEVVAEDLHGIVDPAVFAGGVLPEMVLRVDGTRWRMSGQDGEPPDELALFLPARISETRVRKRLQSNNPLCRFWSP